MTQSNKGAVTGIQIEHVDPKLLKPNPWNTNICSPESESKIEVSLEKFGAFKPVIVRETPHGLQILGGEHRTMASVRLGKKSIPIINLGPISDQEAKEISLIDNGRYGVDDAIGLAKLLEELGEIGDLSTYLPYSESEMESIMAGAEIDLDSLVLDDSDLDASPKSPSDKPIQTHQTMKFRVRVEDAAFISDFIGTVMRDQGFTKDVEEVNAGDALAHTIKELCK